jgi:hypothetical protein
MANTNDIGEMRKSLPLGLLFLAVMASAAKAETSYPVSPHAYVPPHVADQMAAAPAIPPSWYYNPYTSGLSACVQWSPNDPENCRDQKTPSYPWPAYAPVR